MFVGRIEGSHRHKDLWAIGGIILAHSLEYTRSSKGACVPEQTDLGGNIKNIRK